MTYFAENGLVDSESASAADSFRQTIFILPTSLPHQRINSYKDNRTSPRDHHTRKTCN